MDLTACSEAELLSILKENQGHVCARVRIDQVHRHRQLPEVFITSYSAPNQPSLRIFPFIAAGSVLAASCAAPSVPDRQPAPADEIERIDEGPTLTEKHEAGNVHQEERTEDRKNENQRVIIDMMDIPVCGGIDIDSLDTGGVDHVHPTVDAEFPGGLDSLANFIKEHLRYPAWEKEQGISGRVVVLFTVEANGSIANPRIIQDVTGAKNLAPEVLRVIGMMPEWSPAMLHDRPVRTQLTLPVSFTL